MKYVDTQGSEFTEISQKYSNEKLAYGDIIVSAKGSDNNVRYKVLGFRDVYQLSEDNTYAAYGYSQSTVSGNSVETAVTSAIAYVTSSKTKKVALLTGHSKIDYTADYQKLLKANNYEIETISDNIVGKISSDFDAVIIAGPTTDFIGSELDNLSDFLDNDGKLGKAAAQGVDGLRRGLVRNAQADGGIFAVKTAEHILTLWMKIKKDGILC